jgi:ectoine hydroxylase-related dioxygenase (phytanoyl-CoA dioxygenase family)
LNALTYWIPFNRVDRMLGSVEMITGSHRTGLAPVRYTGEGRPPANKGLNGRDLILVEEPKKPGAVIEAKRGDLVAFSQFLMHRSIANLGDKVRWTVQIRHADLAEPNFMAAGYPWGDVTNLYHARYLPADL